jgi:elongation factor G
MRTVVPGLRRGGRRLRGRRAEDPGPADDPARAGGGGYPALLFINKIDTATRRVRETLELLQKASRTPLLLRQIPIWKDGMRGGLHRPRAGARLHLPRARAERGRPSPDGELPREKEARFSMLERLADHDDAADGGLISEIEPPRDRVFDDLCRELREGQVVPVLIGAAERGNGVTRLLKALRHEAPRIAEDARASRRLPRKARRSLR